MRGAPAVCVLAVASLGCRSKPIAIPSEASAAASTVDAAALLVAAARCAMQPGSLALAEPDGIEDLAIGEALSLETGSAIGLLRRGPRGRVASVAFVPLDFNAVSFVDLVAAHPDDPPARPIVLGKQPFALAYEHAPKRRLSLFRLVHAKADVIFSFADGGDDSLAFDVATKDDSGLLAWDEDAPGGIGVVKAAAFFPGSAPTPPLSVSKDTTDAEGPRVAVRTGGYWVAWLARRPEPPAEAGIAETKIESAGEVRTFQWVELAAVDAAGKRQGEVQRLTPQDGHVASFDMVASAAGLDLFARDVAEAKEGEGTRIFRVAVRGDKADPPLLLVKDSVGSGVPDVLSDSAGTIWLAYADTADRTRLLPIFSSTPSPALPSIEPSFEGGRVLLISSPANGMEGQKTVTVALPTDERRHIRRALCGR